MSKKATNFQKKFMSWLFKGKGIFKPLNTTYIDEQVASLREWVANIFFYTKNGKTIMIDAGYNYDRLEEKMSWLNIRPNEIEHILITHQDTDHMGALERDSQLLFKDATIYIGEIEDKYLTGEVRRKVFKGLYKLPKVKTDNKKILLKDGQIFYIYDIKIECILVPGHTWGHMVFLIDDKYLFTGDTIWLGADGGYGFLSILAEDNNLAIKSLKNLEKIIKSKQKPITVITGHNGYTNDLDFVFRHIDKVCSVFSKKFYDPSAPYDAFDESQDIKDKVSLKEFKANKNNC
ncbi:MAG TPA: MBL fold metallo-hydrolase [Clostridia bacterium]|jgi:glyoxylase-like metal-dependent hydrolase (beta-lactamase superfamily II)|nr:MBL fold metallo-hydrolase [Clostridia bacterium]